MRKIEVVRESEMKGGKSTKGITRDTAFELADIIFSRSRVAGGVASNWHHHGTRELFGFVVSGRLTLEYGARGSDVAQLKAGDFVHIPPGLIHRDLNPDEGREAVIVAILSGKGAPVINVEGPEE
jgi:uncharacterized RmlC-like cupin family protein